MKGGRGKRKRILSKLLAEPGAKAGLDLMTRAEIKSPMLNQWTHPGSLGISILIVTLTV